MPKSKPNRTDTDKIRELEFDAFADFLDDVQKGKAAIFSPSTGEQKVYSEKAVEQLLNQARVEELELVMDKLGMGEDTPAYIKKRRAELQAKGVKNVFEIDTGFLVVDVDPPDAVISIEVEGEK